MDTHSPAASSSASAHEIFLSHSGKQKGFARDLELRLSSVGYTVFFDEKDDSLPRGQEFPSQIFSAANSCKLALVLLSEDFITSAWPLMELCCFVDRLPPESSHASPQSFAILPLFYKLSPAELRAEQSVQKWRKEWGRLELERKKDRIDAAKCEKAVTKVLRSLNGVARRPESEQGEPSYIDDIVQRISTILPRRNLALHRYGDGPHKKLVGLERIRQIILQKFKELEDPHSTSQSECNIRNGCILGMFGVSGSGKSTICHYLRDSMFEEFKGKVIHLELPTESMRDDERRIKELYVELFSTLRPDMKPDFESMNLGNLYNLLLQKSVRFSHRMFLVLDNISEPNYASYERIVKAILMSDVLGSGSRVMLTAQSEAILESLLVDIGKKYTYIFTEVPCLTEDEAIEVIKHNCYPLVEEDVIPSLLDKCSFPSSSFAYLPFVLEQIGIALKDNRRSDLKELDRLWRIVDEGKYDAIQKLVHINFKHLPEDLPVLFFDIVLFIIPAGLSELDKATPILCRMHDLTDFHLELKVKRLMKHCALSVIGNRLRVHDIYMEYARRIPGNSKSYVHKPSLNLSDALDTYINGQNRRSSLQLSPIRVHTPLNYSDARTIYIHCDEGVCPNLEEGASYRNLDLEIHLGVKVGSRTRALLVWNSRRYCKCILYPWGDLSSLVFLCMHKGNVQLQSVPLWPTGSDSRVSNLVTLDIRNESPEDISMETWPWQRNRWMNSLVDLFRRQIQNSMPSIRSIWLWNSEPSSPWEQRHLSNRFGFTQHISMKWLRTLILSNAGIRRLEIAGTNFKMLEVLEVESEAQEPIDVSIDNPPKLKNLQIIASSRSKNLQSYNYKPRISNTIIGYLWNWQSRKLTLNLGECPRLQHVRVDDSFDEVKAGSLFLSSLSYLYLANDKCLRFAPTNLISSSMDQLSLLHFTCKVVKSLDFTRQCLSGLPCLREMHLVNCENLRHVSVASSCMPNLVLLAVSSCEKLQVIEGLHHMLLKQLKELTLFRLPQLQIESDVVEGGSCEASTSTNVSRLQLEKISVSECPRVKIDWKVLQAFESMKSMCFVELRICRMQSDEENDDEDIWKKQSDEEDEDICSRPSDEDEEISSKQSDEEDAKRRSSAEQAQGALSTAAELQGRLTFSEGRFTVLIDVYLSRVAHLREINGIQHLHNLQLLRLSELPALARVSGKWPASFQVLRFADCPMLLEIPPLEQTPELWWLSCSNCKSLRTVEGRFGEMKGLKYVDFRWCESMEAFPMEESMEELKKRTESMSWHRLMVRGSKFARVEVMERWLQDAEIGSLLHEAAGDALAAKERRVMSHMVMGNSQEDKHYFLAGLMRFVSAWPFQKRISTT